MKILITGGAGFLGCHLARALLKKDYTVTLLDIAPLDAKDLIGKVTYIRADIRNYKKLEKSIHGHDYIVHAAAALPIQQEKEAIFSTNVDGTRNVLEASLKYKIKRLVFISSTAVYGVPQHLPEKETSPLDPIGYYGESKIQGENLCMAYSHKGLSINIIRPKTFLGPERLGVFELWFEAIYSNKKVFILGSGNNKYQLLAVSDVVDAIIKTLQTKIDGEVFNIGAAQFTTWKKDLSSVIQKASSQATFFSFPVLPSQIALMILEKLHLSPIAAWHYKTLPIDSYVSTAKAKRLLKWTSKKSNSDLLWEAYRWYADNRSEIITKVGTTHRVGWNFKALNLVRKFL